MAYKRLGDLLSAAGAISDEQLKTALAEQKASGKRLGQILIDTGIITQKQLIETLEMQLGVEFIDLGKTILSPDLASYIPKAVAQKYNIVPVKLDKDELSLAMSDPLNFIAIEDAKNISHKKIVPMVSTEQAVDKAISALYGNEGAARAIEEMRLEHSPETEASVFSVGVIDKEDKSSAPTIRLVNSIIERAAVERASDIHLEPREGETVVRMRIDGMLRNILTIPTELSPSVISRLKVMGGMNTSERKIPQDGRTDVRVKDKDIDLRISTLPTVYGEKAVIRLLDKTGEILTREGIGLTGDAEARYEEMIKAKSGVFLIAGPTGSGKSSTMSTIVRELSSEAVNIVTLEDPVEYNLNGVNQVQINEKTGLTFANGLRSILRQDPDIISVGEIRDGETAEIAMRAAITGHLVLSTIHTAGSIETLDRLYDIGVEPYLSASAMKGVIAQRLVRKICPNCRTAYTPDASELRELGMGAKTPKTFYKGIGCPMCYHTGYQGRTAVFEILLINEEIRQAIHNRADHEEILKIARKDGFKTIADGCRDLVERGVISSEEALRAIHSTM